MVIITTAFIIFDTYRPLVRRNSRTPPSGFVNVNFCSLWMKSTFIPGILDTRLSDRMLAIPSGWYHTVP